MIKNLVIGIFTGFCTWWNMLFVILFVLDGGQVYEKWYAWEHGNGVVLAIQWVAAIIGGIAIFVSLENERIEEKKRWERLARHSKLPK